MNKAHAWLSVLASSALLCSASAQVGRETPVVFSTGEYPPYVSQAAPKLGAATEVVSAACRAAGIQPTYLFVPWPRAEMNLKKGLAFAAFPYGTTPDRLANYDFSDPLYQVRNILVIYDGNPKTPRPPAYKILADLRGYTIGIVSGLFIIPDLQRAGLRFETTTTLDQSIRKLRAGRVDLVIDDQAALYATINHLFPAEAAHFLPLATPLDAQRPNFLMVSRLYPKSKEVLQRFNAGLAHIKQSGEYDRIIARNHLEN